MPRQLPTQQEPLLDEQGKARQSWYGWFDDINRTTKGYVTEAPLDGQLYGRTNATWQVFSIGSGAFYYQSSAPSGAVVGSRWVDTTSGILYTLVNDGTSTQWVQF